MCELTTRVALAMHGLILRRPNFHSTLTWILSPLVYSLQQLDGVVWCGVLQNKCAVSYTTASDTTKLVCVFDKDSIVFMTRSR